MELEFLPIAYNLASIAPLAQAISLTLQIQARPRFALPAHTKKKPIDAPPKVIYYSSNTEKEVIK